MSNKAQKVSHISRKIEKNLYKSKENFSSYINEYRDRVIEKLLKGRSVKPCGKECREYGLIIAGQNNHKSFENFKELMNDSEFLLEIASITPNPIECDNFFYNYVNEYLKKDNKFKLEFLKRIYFNDNVYKLADINLIVEHFGFEKENEILLNDLEFRAAFKQRIDKIDYRNMIAYHCSGADKKELQEFKSEKNFYKVLCENKVKGLMEILKSFVVGKEEFEEIDDFYIEPAIDIKYLS